MQAWAHLCVELEQQPAPGLRVRLQRSEAAGHDRHVLPHGVSCTVHGVRSVDKAAWIFTKVGVSSSRPQGSERLGTHRASPLL